MSLVSTWALADDGRLYQNPVLGDATHEWFICFDDDDPIEMVVKAHKPSRAAEGVLRIGVGKQAVLEHVRALIQRLDMKGVQIQGLNHGDGTSRCFEPNDKFHRSVAVWLDIKHPIPARLIIKHDQVADVLPPGDKVFYNFDQPIKCKDWHGNVTTYPKPKKRREPPDPICVCGRTTEGVCPRCGQDMK